MSNQLQSMFPMIRKKKDILNEIQRNAELNKKFYKWAPKFQEEFLNFCSGATENRILYDAFFKEKLRSHTLLRRFSRLLL